MIFRSCLSRFGLIYMPAPKSTNLCLLLDLLLASYNISFNRVIRLTSGLILFDYPICLFFVLTLNHLFIAEI